MPTKPIQRNSELSRIAKEDPTRLRQRTVKPKKGRGSKKRPNNNRIEKEFGKD